MSTTDDPDVSTPLPRWRAQALGSLVLGLVWLTITAGVLVVGTQAELLRTDLDTRRLPLLIASLIVQVAPPIAIVILALVAVRRSRPEASAIIAALEARQARARIAGEALRHQVNAVDRALASIGDRLANLQAAAEKDAHGLTVSAERLQGAATVIKDATQSADGATQTLLTVIEGSRHQAEAVTALLDHSGAETGRQLQAVETMLAAVWTRNADAATQAVCAAAKMTAMLGNLEAAAARANAGISKQAGALHDAADGALSRTAEALETARAGVDSQSSALVGIIDEARQALDHISDEAARVIGRRLDRLNEAAAQLGQRLTEQETRSRGLVDTVERSFTVLDTRLDHAARNSYGALDGIAARMAAVGNQIQSLNSPLRQTNELTVETEAAVARLHASASTVTGTLAQSLPAHQTAVTQLGEALQALQHAALQLAGPVEHSRSMIDVAAGELVVQRSRLEAGAADLVKRCEIARTILGTIEVEAEGSALAAANQLIEVLSRVREIASASAGQMRETLAGVVTEAQAALADAGTATAKQAFGEPIRDELAAVEAASQRAGQAVQTAAERVAQRLLGLTGAIAAVEARIDEVQAHYDLQARDDLQARSARLIESLNAASIDVARLLQLDIGDISWNAYLKGDRSIFTRRVVRLADAATSRAVKRHFNHDAPFQSIAVQFMAEFQQLLSYVGADKDGRALAVTLLSSDIGKLYVVLEQAIGKAK